MYSLNTLLATSLIAATLVSAQGPTSNISASPIIAELDAGTLNSWCVSQRSTCGTLCGGMTDQNDCDRATLAISCTCTSNHSTPALQYYIGSISVFVCNKALGDCLQAHAGDLSGQENCKKTLICGGSNATIAAAAQASASSTSATASASVTGSSTGAAASATKSAGAATIVALGQNYGFAMLGAGLLGAMGILL